MSRTPLRTTRSGGGNGQDGFLSAPVTPVVDAAFVAQAVAADIETLRHDIECRMDKQMNEFRAMFVSLSRTGRSSSLDDDDDDNLDLPRIIPAIGDNHPPLRPNPEHTAYYAKMSPTVTKIPPYLDRAGSTSVTDSKPFVDTPGDFTTIPGSNQGPPATTNNVPPHIDRAAQAQADYERQLTPSISLLYDPAHPVEQREVRWLDPDIMGPYNGKHDRLPKCDFTLIDDSACNFFLLYNCLRNQFSANLFHPELLPDLAYISPTLDLTTTLVDARSLPPVGKEFGGCIYPQVYWHDEHQRLGRTLFMLFTLNKVLNNSPTGLDALSTHNMSGNGFAVLQDLLVLHHPRHHQTLARRCQSHSSCYRTTHQRFRAPIGI
jgi:hypothetical protein